MKTKFKEIQISEASIIDINKNKKSKLCQIFNKYNLLFFLIINSIYFLILICGLSKDKKKNKLSFLYLNDDIRIKNNLLNEKIDFVETKLHLMEEIQNNKILNSNYNKQNNSSYYNLISPMKVLNHEKIRIGAKGDGGYILLKDLNNIRIAYSLGIGKEISFEKYLADKNIDIFMYDYTINNFPFENPRFHWEKIGICGIYSNKNNFKTLSQLIKQNGHSNEKNMILKIDIESHEWGVFQNLPIDNLRQFKYIIGEFHFSTSKKFNYFDILKKISFTHQIFHVHCNNCGKIITIDDYKICNLLEISFLRKNGYVFAKDYSIYPVEGLDYKNCRLKNEISSILNYLKYF
jgi:hypothetical protein